MERIINIIVFLSCIFATCFVVTNCARIHVEDQPSNNAPSPSSSSDTPSDSDDCSDVIFGMTDCVPFMTDGSKVTRPGGSCCPGLEMVIKAGDGCICEAIESTTDFGIPLNMTKVVTLPSACGISASNSLFSQCNLPLPPGASGPAKPPPKSSSRNPPPKEAPTSSLDVAPAPSTAPPLPPPPLSSGTYSVSASFALIVSMLSASLCTVQHFN